MNYVKLAKVLVPALLGLAAVLGYQDAVTMFRLMVCSPAAPATHNADAGSR